MKLRWPSPGFLAVCLAYASSIAFFAWGFRTPELDRIWTLDHELKVGAIWNLNDNDLRVLRDGLRDHPGLAEALLSDTPVGVISAQRDGWVETPEVTVIRTPAANDLGLMELDVQTPEQHLPLRITVRGETWKQKVQADHQGPLYVPLPPLTAPELFTVDFKGKDLRADPSILRTRLSFHAELKR